MMISSVVVDAAPHDLERADDDLVERAEFGHDEQCRAKHGDPRNTSRFMGNRPGIDSALCYSRTPLRGPMRSSAPASKPQCAA